MIKLLINVLGSLIIGHYMFISLLHTSLLTKTLLRNIGSFSIQLFGSINISIMWRLFFLWSRNLDHIYFLLQYVAIVCQSIHFLFYFITYIQDMYTCVKNYLIFVIVSPNIVLFYYMYHILYLFYYSFKREQLFPM